MHIHTDKQKIQSTHTTNKQHTKNTHIQTPHTQMNTPQANKQHIQTLTKTHTNKHNHTILKTPEIHQTLLCLVCGQRRISFHFLFHYQWVESRVYVHVTFMWWRWPYLAWDCVGVGGLRGRGRTHSNSEHFYSASYSSYSFSQRCLPSDVGWVKMRSGTYVGELC